MKTIYAEKLHFQDINQQIRQSDSDIDVLNCTGQRYIGAGQKKRIITVHGTPGNALGAYLDGAEIIIHGNAQDAVGDTMNDGRIIIHGNAGDALGYAMRGGKIYVRGNSGYRTGIHMKEYREKKPVIVVGGSVGSFLGEYLAGGIIIVLGIGNGNVPVGNFSGTGMHGGKIYIRTSRELKGLPEQVMVSRANEEDISEISAILKEYCGIFSLNYEALLRDQFLVLRPNAKNPYKQLYTYN
jgi:glutamate synthase domain-containing protein 3